VKKGKKAVKAKTTDLVPPATAATATTSIIATTPTRSLFDDGETEGAVTGAADTAGDWASLPTSMEVSMMGGVAMGLLSDMPEEEAAHMAAELRTLEARRHATGSSADTAEAAGGDQDGASTKSSGSAGTDGGEGPERTVEAASSEWRDINMQSIAIAHRWLEDVTAARREVCITTTTLTTNQKIPLSPSNLALSFQLHDRERAAF
jgi:hypothetical protein